MVPRRGADGGRERTGGRVAVGDEHQRAFHGRADAEGGPAAGGGVAAVRFERDVEVCGGGGGLVVGGEDGYAGVDAEGF